MATQALAQDPSSADPTQLTQPTDAPQVGQSENSQNAPGISDRNKLAAAGFGAKELDDWEGEERTKLSAAGFSQDEVDEHFGKKQVKSFPMADHINKNLEDYGKMLDEAAEESPNSTPVIPPFADDDSKIANNLPGPPPIVPTDQDKWNANSFPEKLKDAVQAGFQMSVTGLFKNGKLPTTMLPEDVGTFYRIASQMSTLAGDLPAMIAGNIAGRFVGAGLGATAASIIPGAGTAAGAEIGSEIGGNAGMWALPAVMRSYLISHYQKGDITDFQDFWERSSAAFLDGLKQGAVGVATGAVGSGVGKAFAPVVAPAATKTAAVLASEVATMVSLGRAMDGQVPKLTDFTDAGIAVLFMHGVASVPELSSRVTEKLQNIYVKTGIRPEQVVEQATTDFQLKQELVSSGGPAIPKALQPFEAKRLDAETTPQDPTKGVEPLPGETGKSPIDKDTPKTVDVSKSLLEAPKGLLPQDPEELQMEPLPRSLKDILTSERGSTSKDFVRPEPTTELGKAQAQVLDQLTTRPGKSGEPLSWNSFYENMVDKYDPFRRLVKTLAAGETLPTKEDPYKLARLAVDSVGKASHFLKFGTFDFDSLKNNGESLQSIIEPFKNNRDGLNAYLAASRALELNERGINPGIPVEAAKKVVEGTKAKYDEAAQKLNDYQNRVLGYLKDSGVISQESYDKMVDASNRYVPFYRISEEGNAVGGGKKSSTSNPIKGIRGLEEDSTSKTVEPIESIVRNTFEYVRLAENNRAMLALNELAAKSEIGQELVKPVPVSMKPIEVKPEEIARYLRGLGMNDATPESVDAFNIFRALKQPLEDNQIASFKEGKLQVSEVSPDVARAYRAMSESKEGANLLFKLAAAPAKALRATLGLTPDFILRNFFRDQVTAAQFSKYKGLPFVDSLRALGNLWTEDDGYQNWLKSGGTSGSFASIDREYIDQNVWQLSKKTGLLDSAVNVIRHPLEMIRVASELVESATRLAEAKRIMGSDPSTADIFEGGFGAREVTVDFQRMGAKTQAWNMLTAFWNANVQGVDRAARAFADRPAETSLRVAASITLPSVLLWWANKDNKDVQDLPQWQKDLFWILPVGDHLYRLPKPFEVGILFGSLAERTLDAFYQHKPDAFKDFADTAFQGLLPNLLPTAPVPFIEHFANKSTFTGHYIVPKELEGIKPEYQATEYTTESAKILGKIVAQIPVVRDWGPDHEKLSSPLVIQNYIRAWSGNLGTYFLQAADRALIAAGTIKDPKHADTPLAQMPFIKAFMIQSPSPAAQPIQDFYENYTAHKEQADTLMYLMKTGNTAAMSKEMKDPETQEKLVNLSAIKTALAAQTQAIHKIDENSSMKTSEKRQMIDQIYSGMIETARAGNQIVEGMKKK